MHIGKSNIPQNVDGGGALSTGKMNQFGGGVHYIQVRSISGGGAIHTGKINNQCRGGAIYTGKINQWGDVINTGEINQWGCNQYR